MPKDRYRFRMFKRGRFHHWTAVTTMDGALKVAQELGGDVEFGLDGGGGKFAHEVDL